MISKISKHSPNILVTARLRGWNDVSGRFILLLNLRAASMGIQRRYQSLVFGRLVPNRSVFPDPVKASLMSGFNSLLRHNYFPVPQRREFVV